jgi:hypothetical protein
MRHVGWTVSVKMQCRCQDLGFGVWGSGFRRFRVQDSGCEVNRVEWAVSVAIRVRGLGVGNGDYLDWVQVCGVGVKVSEVRV